MVTQIVRNFSIFMDHGGLLTTFRRASHWILLWAMWLQFTLLHPISWRSILCLFLPSVLVPWNFSAETLYVYFIPPIGALWLPYVKHLSFCHPSVWWTLQIKKHISMHFFAALCNCYIGSNLFLSIPCEIALSLCSSYNFRYRVPCPYRTTGWGLYFSSMLRGLSRYLVVKILRLLLVPYAGVRHWTLYQHAVLKR
jgi:hypothetical protein